MNPKVVIIGAGPSGLVALKEMLALGLDAMIIEKASSFGGVFREDNAAVYEDLYLTTSNYFMAFSDFAPRIKQMKYTTKQEYTAYLKAYVEHFDLVPHIQFNTTVIQASQDANKVWNIKTNHITEGQKNISAEHLIVATGAHHVPNHVDIQGFTGNTIHSSAYVNNAPYKDKRVLVIGIGESAADIAANVSKVAKQTVVWSRRPFLAAPRFPLASLLNKDYDEAEYLPKRAFKHVDDYNEFFSINRLANTLSVIGYSMIRILVIGVIKAVPLTSKTSKQFATWMRKAVKGNYWQQDQAMIVTKNCRLATLVAEQKLGMIIAKTMTCKGKSVQFEEVHTNETGVDHVSFEFDEIITCSGYKTQFDWLDADITYNARTWYKHCFPPNYGSSLLFLGWARPQQGGIPACSEMLARYAALLISGERQLPENIAELTAEEAQVETEFYSGSPHVDALVDYPAFMDSVAKLIGCMPAMPNPLLQPALFFKYWIFPCWACWYRKDGVGKDPAALQAFLQPTSYGFGPSVGLVIIQVLLILFSLPLYGLHWVIKSMGLISSESLGFGWMWGRPKIQILHGNG